MKSILWVGVIAASALISSSALACDCGKAKADTKKDKTTAKQKATATQEVLVTGSYIKRPVDRNGRITDGPSQVVVLDQETIRRTGASDVRQLLVRKGVVP